MKGRYRYLDWKKLTEEAAEELAVREEEARKNRILNTAATGKI